MLLFAGTWLACSRTEPPSPTPAPTPAPTASPRDVRKNDEEFARRAALSEDGEARLEAVALLDGVLRSEAANPANAWALAHGMLAYGRNFEATDGRLAAEVLAQDFLTDLNLPGGGSVKGFPRTRGEVRVEPHTDLIIKSLLEAGWGFDEPLPGVETTPRDLVEGSRKRFDPLVPPASAGGGGPRFETPNDAPWSMAAWCRASEADGAPASKWTTATGEAVHLDGLATRMFATLEKETWFLRQAKAAGTEVKKRRQGIFAYSCGGSHLFQGVATCAAAGLPEGTSPTRLQNQIELYLDRISIETRAVDQALPQFPALRSVLYNQDVKFLGHLLESLGKAERDGLWTPSSADRALLEMAETRLVFHVLQQKKIGTYRPQALEKLRTAKDKNSQNPLEGFQFYLDLVGDAAHARHGLKLQSELRKRRIDRLGPTAEGQNQQ